METEKLVRRENLPKKQSQNKLSDQIKLKSSVSILVLKTNEDARGPIPNVSRNWRLFLYKPSNLWA